MSFGREIFPSGMFRKILLAENRRLLITTSSVSFADSFSTLKGEKPHMNAFPSYGEEMATRDLTRDGTAETKRSGV